MPLIDKKQFFVDEQKKIRLILSIILMKKDSLLKMPELI